MKYMGGKNRLAKELAPIIQSYINENTEGYLEPFVGGANMIDKIKHEKKIGYDINKYLIALLNYVKITANIPSTISEDEYYTVKFNKDKYDDWYVGLVGFCASFGADFFNGYARGYKSDKVTPRDMPNEAIRNILKQRENILDIEFIEDTFLNIPKDIKGYVIYCDPPYKNSVGYRKLESFPHDKFYEWVKEMSIHNTVLISEYNMPEEFTCIWSKETKANFDSNRKSNDDKNVRIERLYTYKIQ